MKKLVISGYWLKVGWAVAFSVAEKRAPIGDGVRKKRPNKEKKHNPTTGLNCLEALIRLDLGGHAPLRERKRRRRSLLH